MRDWLIVAFWTIAITLMFVFTSRHANADDVSFKYGMGLLDGSPTGSIKQFSFRDEHYLFYGIHSAGEGGLWVDNLGGGRKDAVFGKYQLGVKPGAETGVYAKAFWGVQLQSSVDSRLGGYAEFSQDAGVGIRDAFSFVEAGYTHVSSAGIFAPNYGRDFVTLSMGLRF